VCDEFEAFLRIKFPLSKSKAMVLFLVILAWVDQIMELVDWFKTTRLPSWEILSSGAEVVGLLKGSSLFATHAWVNLGTLLNHMPRYQLLVFWDELLPTLKKPSAYLPFLETSLSPMVESAWPAEMVSVVAEFAAGMCRESSSTMEMWR